jgi:hypothetical protein
LSFSSSCGDLQAIMADQVLEMIRNESLRHLEFAWEAQRKLARLCQDNNDGT